MKWGFSWPCFLTPTGEVLFSGQPRGRSRDIAALTGKQHNHVTRDIRVMTDAMGDDSKLNHLREEKDARGYTACFHLDRYYSEVLVTGYDVTQQGKPLHKKCSDQSRGAMRLCGLFLHWSKTAAEHGQGGGMLT